MSTAFKKEIVRVAERAGLAPLLFRYKEWRAGRNATTPDADEAGLPIPPPHLVYQVVAHTDWRHFLQSGEESMKIFADAVDRNGGSFRGAQRILDLGVGCGRIARHASKFTQAEMHGVDYNARLARWCAKNLKGRYSQNRLEPPLDFPPAHFDIAYLYSVFTHLRRPTQDAWLAELARVLRPGGLALVTFHDEDHIALPSVGLGKSDLVERGFIVHHDAAEGSNFMATFQSRAVFTAQSREHFDVLEIVDSAKSALGQALGVLRRREG
jgi:SAM-dependent methyltransferase